MKTVINAWASYATPYRWRQLDPSGKLRKAVKSALGQHRDPYAQFGNVIGWLNDMGERDLARQVRRAIAQWNADQDC